MKVFCVGIVVLDRVYHLAQLPSGGGKHLAQAYRETGGGMAATAALAVARLGGTASWCGPIGDDATGRQLRAELAAGGVDVGPAEILAGVRTPISVVLVQGDGERCLILDRDPGLHLTAPVVPPRARVVLADPRFAEAALSALEQARARGLHSVLDGEVAAPAALPSLTGAATHPVFSRAGLRELTGEADPAAGLRRLERDGAGVTLGPEGSQFLVGGRVVAIPAPRVRAQDTTGCGDVFHGAFALGLAEGMDVLRAARFATAAASLKGVRGQGWAGIPDRTAVEGCLARDWC
ncbi:MAG: ribokinase [Acetobacteraceae bacterium]|nr:ribokinase [Acetobacteraceae bacterium]